MRTLNGSFFICRSWRLLLVCGFQVQEKVVDYTLCTKNESNDTCAEYIQENLGAADCSCKLVFELTEDFPVCITIVVINVLCCVKCKI